MKVDVRSRCYTSILRVSPISVTGTWAIIWRYVKVDVRSRCYTSILRVSPISVTGTWGHHLALCEGRCQVQMLYFYTEGISYTCYRYVGPSSGVT